MRKLALAVYGVVLFSLLSSMWVIERFDRALYEEEIVADYESYTNLLLSLMVERLKAGNTNISEVLTGLEAYYEEATVLNAISNANSSLIKSAVIQAKISSIEVNADEQTDYVLATASISMGNGDEVLLEFTYVDSYSDEYIAFHRIGSLVVFIVLGLVISVLMYYLYRYLMSISQVTRSIALGQFDEQMPNSRFEALQVINRDINSMSRTLEHNAQENIIFMGALHHELRLPITRLRLAMDMVLHSKDRDGVDAMIRDMDADLDDLIELSEEMLSLARLALESGELPNAPLQLDEILSDLVDSFDDERIHLQLTSTNTTIVANSTALERVLVNIIGNGTKYARGRVEIKVERESKYIKVIVEDDGPGIPENELEQVLKPFYRVDKGRDRNTGGFGLGLAIASSLVRKASGELKLSRSSLGGLRVEIVWGQG